MCSLNAISSLQEHRKRKLEIPYQAWNRALVKQEEKAKNRGKIILSPIPLQGDERVQMEELLQKQGSFHLCIPNQ